MPTKKTAAAKSSKTAPRSSSRQTRRAAKESAVSETLVTIDRRRGARRSDANEEQPAAAALERRKKVQRRRQIDPTTCERDYTIDEVEFMNAMDEYKRKSGRMFPTCSEVLEVIRGLGYLKLSPVDRAALAVEQNLEQQFEVVDALVEEAEQV
jgi:hypothetical protein